MSSSIPSHFSVHEINQHKLDVEYNHWISRLNFFEVELDFYKDLLTSEKFKFACATADILKKIAEMKEATKKILEKTHSYRNNLDAYRECEDLECDNFYLNDHEKFRIVLEQHSADLRNFKSEVFEILRAQL